MSPSKSYIQCLAIVLLLTVYSTQQVSARLCYRCNSDLDTDCIRNPAQKKFAVQCSVYVINSNSTVMDEPNTHDDAATNADIEYDCVTAIGISTEDGHSRVERGCAVRAVICDTYKYVYAVGDGQGNGFQIDDCRRCNTDFCNYSI